MLLRCVMIFMLVLPTLALSQEQQVIDEQKQPSIGLVLSGGGARGAAHVGVLKVLEELGVRVDYVAGTSMGAIVGGMYAAGFSADEIEKTLVEMDWNQAFRDESDRQHKSMRKKETEADFLIDYRLGYNDGKIQLPLGVLQGQRLSHLFNRILHPVLGIDNFDDFPIPFRAVATDLVTGQEVILSEGSLATALRASMSIPGAFAPVSYQDTLLVDGGMANNLPISVVRDMGADMVIAVDVSMPLLKRSDLDSVLSVTEQITNFLTRNNTDEQIKTLGHQDVLLIPDLYAFTSGDFQRMQDIIDAGYEAASTDKAWLTAVIREQALDQPQLVKSSAQPITLDFIRLNNDSRLHDDILLSHIESQEGEQLDLDQLEEDLERIYGLDVFESVTYSIIYDEEAGKSGVLIDAVARSWGPNYFQFGLELSDDFGDNSDFSLGAAYTRNALNKLGGELRSVVTIGRESGISFDLYQPLDSKADFFIEPSIFYLRREVSQFDDSVLTSRVGISGLGVNLAVGRNFGTTGQLRLDYEYLRGDLDLLVGQQPMFDDKLRIGEVSVSYQYDALDNLNFPEQGAEMEIQWRHGSEELGGRSSYDQYLFSSAKVFTWGRYSLLSRFDFNYTRKDNAPIEREFQLGGFGNLSGLVPDQLSGQHSGLFVLAAYRQLNDVDFLPVYAGFSLEVGNVWQRDSDIGFDDLRKAGSLFIGADTVLGPVYFAWGQADSGDSTFYFYLGNPFGISSF